MTGVTSSIRTRSASCSAADSGGAFRNGSRTGSSASPVSRSGVILASTGNRDRITGPDANKTVSTSSSQASVQYSGSMGVAEMTRESSGACPTCDVAADELATQVRDAVRLGTVHQLLPSIHSDCPVFATAVSHFDGLTGLPNRRFFLERLDHVIADARAQRFDIAVLAVDIDRLRKVNGSLGHRVGDKVLETVASRLRGLRRNDTV